jgi:hypothetical protein
MTPITPDMNRKGEKLAKKIEKAGIRACRKEGHILTETELRKVKVQLLPVSLRVVFCLLGVIAALIGYLLFVTGSEGYGFLLALTSALSLLFGMYGVRKTLSRILDSMDAADALEILGHAAEGIASAVGSLLDGV